MSQGQADLQRRLGNDCLADHYDAAADLADSFAPFLDNLGLARDAGRSVGRSLGGPLGIKDNSSGLANAAKPSRRSHFRKWQLPTEGKVRYIPPRNWHPDNALPRGPNAGFMDRFGNEWVRGPSRTRGEPFEWDVQRPDGTHWNISLRGRVTH